MTLFHHRRLPNCSTLLSGHTPRDEVGFRSKQLQIWYNYTDESWIGAGEKLHMHTLSDECFIVLHSTLIVEVDGEQFKVGPREFCCFPCGVYHAIVEIHPPVEMLMIRAPSANDKVYQSQQVEESTKGTD